MATEKGAKAVFLGLLVGSIVLLAVVVSPFAKAFFLAATLAGALHGLHERVARWLRGRRTLAAGLLCFGVVVALLLPLSGLVTFIVQQTIVAIDFVTETVRIEGLEGLIGRLPRVLQGPVERLIERFEVRGQGAAAALQEQITARGPGAAQVVSGIVAATGSAVFQAVMMLIALFFFLLDGPRLVGWLESTSPLKRGQTTEILREFRSVTVAVLVSSLVTAGVQTIAALAGFLIARVPVPLFFAAVTFFFALIPAIGAAVVCLAAALVLLSAGHPWAALFLALWGIFVVGLSDNVVKPLLVRRGMHLHGAIVFFSLLGGLAAFGMIGLLIGPLSVALFLALVRIYERDYGRPSPRPGAPAAPPD